MVMDVSAGLPSIQVNFHYKIVRSVLKINGESSSFEHFWRTIEGNRERKKSE